MRSRLGSMLTAQLLLKLMMPSASRRTLYTGSCAPPREYVELEVARHAAVLIATSLPMTCAASMVTVVSLCVGLTLPGMMDEPGSFSGMVIADAAAAPSRAGKTSARR